MDTLVPTQKSENAHLSPLSPLSLLDNDLASTSTNKWSSQKQPKKKHRRKTAPEMKHLDIWLVMMDFFRACYDFHTERVSTKHPLQVGHFGGL